MSITITEGMQWPPIDLERYKMREHSVWYSGEADLLADFYYASDLQNVLELNYKVTNANKFWSRQIRNGSNFFMHVPIASDIAETSSAFLFGEAPVIRFKSSSEGMVNAQNDLDDMLTKSGFFQKLVEGAEIASAIGGVFFKLNWDSELSENPIPTIVQCEQAFPTFKFGLLSKVTFMYDVYNDNSTVYRLAETVRKGEITNQLYKGSSSCLGKLVDLKEIEQTKDLEETVSTGEAMTAFYIPNKLPNKLNRQSNFGRSDLQGVETLMDALDETFSAWMLDVQIARGKIHVPSSYIKSLDGEKGKFNIDTSIYVELEVDPTMMTDPIKTTQFEIRADMFEKTCLNLMDRIITSAGYSPQSFGLNIQGRAESGTALNVRERKSFSTTNKKQSYWEAVLCAIVKNMCLLKNQFLGGSFSNELDINVAFMDCISNNGNELANSIKLLSDASAVSTETKIRMAHPEWSDAQVMEELEKINNDKSFGMPQGNPEDLFEMGLGNNQGNKEGSSDVKSEGLDNISE